MKNVRKYGNSPFSIAVIHGGPGAPGTMAIVARELALICGVLEPLQTATTIAGQLRELQAVLKAFGELPVVLVGHSWGAWLSYIFTAHNPELIKKIILVGSGPFEEKYASGIMETRLSRLDETERLKIQTLIGIFNDPGVADKDNILAQFGKLISKADSFAPLTFDYAETEIKCQGNIYQNVWQEASKLRKSGQLLKLGKEIRCPVLAIHGDYDPHPCEGVEKPLSRVVKNFRLIRLEKCGHEPWNELYAKDRFYGILEEELNRI